jgi:hypothetical protein
LRAALRTRLPVVADIGLSSSSDDMLKPPDSRKYHITLSSSSDDAPVASRKPLDPRRYHLTSSSSSDEPLVSPSRPAQASVPRQSPLGSSRGSGASKYRYAAPSGSRPTAGGRTTTRQPSPTRHYVSSDSDSEDLFTTPSVSPTKWPDVGHRKPTIGLRLEIDSQRVSQQRVPEARKPFLYAIPVMTRMFGRYSAPDRLRLQRDQVRQPEHPRH